MVIFLNLLPILALSDPTDIPGWILALAFLSLPVLLANENKYFSYFLSAVAMVICIFLFISSQTSFGLLLLASFSVVAGLTLLENRSWMVQTLLALLIVFSWALVSPFNVYSYISKFMETNAKYFVISFLASFVLCWNYVFGERKELAALSKSALLLYGVGIVSLFLLSFRNDFIFAGSGEPRWEYVIEIIRELKNGSTMLWDVPAQHGLLNFYLASLLPMTEGTAFYLLNALLLFIVATLFMMTFISPRRNWQANLFLFLLTISTLFFTNPHFLEPYPYRGATIMRFFWCYLILFFIFNRFKVKQLGARSTYLGLTCVWLLGSFWSLESALLLVNFWSLFNILLRLYF